MKTLLLLIAIFLLAGCVSIAEGKGRPVDKGLPPGLAKRVTPTLACQTELVAAAISGDAVFETLARGSTTLVADPIVPNIWAGPLSMTMDVVTLAGREGIPLPPDWVTFEPQAFCLQPGQWERVDIWIAVPQGATTGLYFGLLRALSCLGNSCAAAAIEATITVE